MGAGLIPASGSARGHHHYLPPRLAALACTKFHHHVVEISRGRIIASYLRPVRYCGQPRIPDPGYDNLAQGFYP
jgi:hypothetical protein